MSTDEIALHKPHEAPVLFDEEKRDLLRKTLCPRDITPNEFELFVAVCQRTGLDPFAKQIYAIKRGGKLCIDASIDGFRLIAARTGEYAGQEGPFWCGEDGIWKDVWLSNGLPLAAKVGVWRNGFKTPVWGVALFKSFAQNFNGRLGDQWQKMPDVMIAKCAESQALRKAFPAELSGVYTSDEMAQAENVPNVNLPPAGVDTETGEIYDEEAVKAAAKKEAQERATAKAEADKAALAKGKEFAARLKKLGYDGDPKYLAKALCKMDKPLASDISNVMQLTDDAWVHALTEGGIIRPDDKPKPKPEDEAADLELSGEPADPFADEQPAASAQTLAAMAR